MIANSAVPLNQINRCGFKCWDLKARMLLIVHVAVKTIQTNYKGAFRWHLLWLVLCLPVVLIHPVFYWFSWVSEQRKYPNSTFIKNNKYPNVITDNASEDTGHVIVASCRISLTSFILSPPPLPTVFSHSLWEALVPLIHLLPLCASITLMMA